MLIRKVGLGAAAALALVLVAAPGAWATTFIVNSTLDTPDDPLGLNNDVCDDGSGNCTLRAAIQETEDTGSPGADQIDFAAGVVDSTIAVSSDLDPITQTLTLDGCSSVIAPTGPCVGLDRSGVSPTGNGLFMSQNPANVSITGVAITNFNQGIMYGNGSTGLQLTNSWFGLEIDGSTVDGNSTGVQVTGDSATVGGTAASDRNVFVGNSTALTVFGGINDQILGNYFGVLPDGATASSNATNIALDGSSQAEVTGTVIGGAPDTSGACDGPCNVISGATSSGIDLQPTPSVAAVDGVDIKGNFIGYSADGSTAIGNATGIRVVNAANVEIGGTGDDKNYITGGTNGISANFQGAPGLDITGNQIGTNIAGTATLTPPSFEGISLQSVPAEPANVVGNTIAVGALANHAILLQNGGGAFVGGNLIGVGPGGEALGGEGVGIRTVSIADTTINGNTIGNADTDGITIEAGDDNTVTGNLIGVDGLGGDQANGANGVNITDFGNPADPATGNTIGGDLPAAENVISNNGRDAIQVLHDGSDGNVIARNVGGANGSDPGEIFIDLVGDNGDGNGAIGPNGGIDSPDLEAASAARSVGLATPGATVRAFAHTDSEFSSLGAFAGSGTADSRGLWQVAHATPPSGGKGLAVSQTTASDGTSELSIVGAAFLDPPDKAAPGAAISAGPNGPTSDTTPTFTLNEPTNDPNFQVFFCATDAGLYQPCGITGSTYTTAPLSQGGHSVTIRGVDEAANLSAPLTRAFTVDSVPPATTITKGPKGTVKAKGTKKKVIFEFTSTESGGGFQCQIDSTPFVLCSSPFSRKLRAGKHTFRVRAYDAAGNPDPSLEIRKFRIKRKRLQ